GECVTDAWTQSAGPTVALSNASDSSPTFTAPEVTADTDLTFQLSVGDGIASATSSVTITVKNVNRVPVAVASAQALANERDSITLDGSSSFDPDGTLLTYTWTAAGALPAGASISNGTAAMATFNTGEVTADTAVTFHLVVNDGSADSTAASVTVTVRNVDRAPVA